MFSIPDTIRHPRSLRDILIDKDFKGQVMHPLNERLSLEKQLVRAVLHIQSKVRVRKNIRPETILLFEDAEQDAERSDRSQRNTKHSLSPLARRS